MGIISVSVVAQNIEIALCSVIVCALWLFCGECHDEVPEWNLDRRLQYNSATAYGQNVDQCEWLPTQSSMIGFVVRNNVILQYMQPLNWCGSWWSRQLVVSACSMSC